MAKSRTASTYNEPTIMWRMQRGDRMTAHAVIAPTVAGANVVWFVNGRPVGMRDFDDWTGAITWCERIRHQNWAAGWRLTPDDNE
jgi:hypothetical protein